MDLVGSDGTVMREALSQSTALRELYGLYEDAISHNRPAGLLSVLRNRMQEIVTLYQLVLPAEMPL